MAAKTRILYFVANPHTFTGSHRSLLQLLLHLPEEIEPLVAAPFPGVCLDRYRERGIPTTVIPTPEPLNAFDKALVKTSNIRRAWLFLRYVLPYSLRFAGFLRRNEIDLVHCNGSRGVLLVGWGTRLARRPLVCHIRGMFAFDGALRVLPQLLSHRLILVAEALRESIARRFRAKAVTVHNAVDEASFETPPASDADTDELPLPTDPQRPTIAVLATVVPAKGIHLLLEALELLVRQGVPEPLVLIAGSTPDSRYVDYLRSLTEQSGLQHVHLLGYRADPAKVYRRADIVAVPSVPRTTLDLGEGPADFRSNEGLPRAAIEAMHFGKPVVTTDIAGASEAVLDGVTGIVVPPDDPGRLAGALTTLIEDPGRRTAMGEAGAARARAVFSTKHLVEATVAVYGSLGEHTATTVQSSSTESS